jgi:putative oxidoreductase
LDPLVWPILRVTAGLLLVPHGCQKLFGWFGGRGLAATGQYFASLGFEPGYLFATLIALLEFAGGLMLAVGLLTRPVAAAVVVFMAVAVVEIHWPNGIFWTDKGFEYPLMWGVLALAFVIRGGGRYSMDALIGREI